MDFKKEYNIDGILIIVVVAVFILCVIFGELYNELIILGTIWLVIRLMIKFPTFSLILLMLGLGSCDG
jgi:hypothetical protein